MIITAAAAAAKEIDLGCFFVFSFIFTHAGYRCSCNWIELDQEQCAEKSLADCAALHVLMGLLTAGCTKAAARQDTRAHDNMWWRQAEHTHTQRPVRSHKAPNISLFFGRIRKNDIVIMQPKKKKKSQDLHFFPSCSLLSVFYFYSIPWWSERGRRELRSVEQEALSRLMMPTDKIHIGHLLNQTQLELVFVDVCYMCAREGLYSCRAAVSIRYDGSRHSVQRQKIRSMFLLPIDFHLHLLVETRANKKK